MGKEDKPMPGLPSKEQMEKIIRPTSYHRLYEVRAVIIDPKKPAEGQNPDDMILEGKAIAYGEKTQLFEFGGKKIYEVIDPKALEGADTKDCFLKYNHSEEVMVMARTKNGTLTLDNRPDGLFIRAKLANTTAGRDLYELVKRGDIDKMSFAFTTDKEEEDDSVEGEITYTVRKIRKLYDVAAVPMPAYEDTELYARRQGDVETYLAKVETQKRDEELRREKIIALGYLGQKLDDKK